MPASTSRYTQRHFQDFAALLAAEREQNGPSPALSRIITAVTQLFAENSANFNRELFGKAARGTVSPAARPRRKPQSGVRAQDRPGWDEAVAEAGRSRHAHRFDGQSLTHEHNDGDAPHGYYEHPEDAGWTPPVIVPVEEPQS